MIWIEKQQNGDFLLLVYDGSLLLEWNYKI